ncbi:MAG: sugar phosphate nucleotidyltransferase, partial [Stellaceae bacterium]
MIPVVLSGGSGTRLWPLSREFHPKQFLSLDGSRQTLFQATLKRLQGLVDLEPLIVVANAEHRFLVAEQLRQAGVEDATILLEPNGRNTAPALAAAALAARKRDARSLILALPADHVIRDAP